jgi:prepilin-type N-terminal cleavage/methylation domain-containing protein
MQKGFTIIETLIVIVLVGVMLIVLSEFFFGTSNMYRSQDAELQVNFAARVALDDIDAYVRQATVALGYFDIYTAGPTVLILELPSIDSSQQIIPGIFDQVIISKTGSQIFRRVIPNLLSSRIAEEKLLADNVTSLVFEYNDLDYAQVSEITTTLNISNDTGKELRTLDISSRSTLRNKNVE